jgi:hypothetical protein
MMPKSAIAGPRRGAGPRKVTNSEQPVISKFRTEVREGSVALPLPENYGPMFQP